MKYIILDLEWNSAYSVKESRFINEIIEIGAVKLDENLNEIGRYQQLVRSRLNKKLSSRTKNLTHITNEDMLSGVMLEKALAERSLRLMPYSGGKNSLALSFSGIAQEKIAAGTELVRQATEEAAEKN